MDKLVAMRTFARVIDEGSFSGAARALDVSPASVTKLVADLEDQLGARLINRTTRRLALTDVGEAYLERVRAILADIGEAEAQAGVAMREPRGHLRVLVPPAFSVHQFARHLPRFRALYPRLTLELSVPGPVETVDENFDLSILMVGRRSLQGDFVARLLAHSEVILCAAPDYLARRGTPAHPSELAGHDLLEPTVALAPRELSFQPGPGLDAAEAVTITARNAVLHTAHVDTHHAAARAGLGIAGLPSFVAAEALLQGHLVRVLPHWRLLTLRLYAAMPTRKHVPARTRALLDFLVQSLGGEARDPWLAQAGCETC